MHVPVREILYLHVAARHGSGSILELICDRFSQLITRRYSYSCCCQKSHAFYNLSIFAPRANNAYRGAHSLEILRPLLLDRVASHNIRSHRMVRLSLQIIVYSTRLCRSSASRLWLPVIVFISPWINCSCEFLRAEHVIHIKLDVVALLRIYVGDVPTWKNPQNAWRSDSRFNLTSLLMLIQWENDTIEGRQDDNEAYIEDKIEALIA
ncbi:hypothetical protein K1719_037505 [Acacia pycnantha]|nr:hypothetical protein K1719_037505 [Acacia pycnantha]